MLVVLKLLKALKRLVASRRGCSLLVFAVRELRSCLSRRRYALVESSTFLSQLTGLLVGRYTLSPRWVVLK